MKIDPATTFLNSGSIGKTERPVPRKMSSKTKMRLVCVGIVLVVAAYLAVVGMAIWDQMRPAVVAMSDGWFSVHEREHGFEIELPSKPKNHGLRAFAQYSAYHDSLMIYVASNSVARQLLNNSEVKLLQDSMKSDETQGTAFEIGNGVMPDGTLWLEYRIKGPASTFRRRLLLKKKEMLSVTVQTSEVHADLITDEINRVMTSAKFIR